MDYVSLSQKLLSKVYAVYNGMAGIKFAFSPRVKAIIRKNKALKDIHQGQKCFVLGLGPSLKSIDLSLIKDEKVLALNSFYKYAGGEMIDPTYYFMMDHCFYGCSIDEVVIATNRYKSTRFFFNLKARKHFLKNLDIDISKHNFLYSKKIQHGNVIKCNPTKNMTAAVNVVLSCIQLAIYMGFKEIYLLGCDFNYFATCFKQEHCYSSDIEEEFVARNVPNAIRSLAVVLDHHNALDNYSKEVGAKIYNATDGSFIRSCEFVKYMDIVKPKTEVKK